MQITDGKIVGLEFEHYIADGELRVFHGSNVVAFKWPLVFGWSLKGLNFRIRQALGLWPTDAAPPAIWKMYD